MLFCAPIVGQQKKMQYPERYRNATAKWLWNKKYNDVSLGNRDIWGNMNTMVS